MTRTPLAAPARPAASHSRHVLRAAITALLVVVTGAAGWAVAPSNAGTTRVGPQLVGAVTKSVGPAATRTVRATFPSTLVRAAQSASATQRVLRSDSSSPLHTPLLGVLVALLVLAAGLVRLPLLARRTSAVASGRTGAHRGRAPPHAVPTPA